MIWITSDFQERLDGDRGRPVTLERQTTTRRRLVLGHIGPATQDAVFVRGQPHLLRHRKEYNTPRVSREGEDERLVLTDLPVTTRTRSRTQRQMVQLTLTGEEATEIEVRCECGKLCKNQRGLKIHQSKSKCGDVRTQTQRTEVPSDETQEITSQDSTHSTGDLSTSESSHDSSSILNEVPRRERKISQQHHAKSE